MASSTRSPEPGDLCRVVTGGGSSSVALFDGPSSPSTVVGTVPSGSAVTVLAVTDHPPTAELQRAYLLAPGPRLGWAYLSLLERVPGADDG